MLVYGIMCYYTGWVVSIHGGVLVYRIVLVNGMGCYFPGWGVSIRDGVLVYGMGC